MEPETQPGACWPDAGEIDIMEMINGDHNCHGSLHSSGWPTNNCTHKEHSTTSITKVDDFWTGFHEYAVEWKKDYIAFFVDGVMYSNQTDYVAAGIGYPHYWILNTAIEGGWPHVVVPETVFPTYHIIDYVKIMEEK